MEPAVSVKRTVAAAGRPAAMHFGVCPQAAACFFYAIGDAAGKGEPIVVSMYPPQLARHPRRS
jgi:hypothetical protein